MPEELQRVHDKINYETNVVDPKTFAVLLKAVKDNQPLTYEKGRDQIFPQARANAGMQWDPTKVDTHASGTLEQYGLVIPDENRTIKVSDLGYKFLSCFDSNFDVVVDSDTYKTVLLEMIFVWKEEEHGRSIHPGRILFKLLLDKDLNFYTTNNEFALWTSHPDSMRDRDYLKIKKLILDYRKNPTEVKQKKAEVFLRPFANSWDLFDRTIDNSVYSFTIKDDVLPLVKPFFITSNDEAVVENAEQTNIEEKIIECWNNKAFEYEEVDSLYDEFNSMFGLEAIKLFTPDECLDKLFGKVDDNSLVYNLEHVAKFDYFAHVGGYRTIYTLYEKDGEWKYGSSGANVKTITRDEAVQIAVLYRDSFVKFFNYINDLKANDELNAQEGFLKMQDFAKANLGILYGRNWVWKYCHMLFPDIFTTFFSEEWINKIFRVAQIVPESTYLLQCYQFSSLAKKLQILIVYVYHILVALDDSEANIAEENETLEVEAANKNKHNSLPVRTIRTYKQYPLNLILYGAPGTGKTYSTMQLACSIVDKKTDSIDDICEGKIQADREEVMKKYNSLVEKGQITFTTFHQSYGYEDFIQGLRPDNKSETLKFVPADGVFKRIVEEAIIDPINNYVIIIDEINRANISKVLGELITLLENDKRWGEINQLSTILPSSGETFAVPNNLYVIGTMNSADKSISLIDAALRRRFEFVEVSVNYDLIGSQLMKNVLSKINEKLEAQLDTTDLLVGHAYFLNKDESELCDILNHNVIPLLYEYFFDSKTKVKDVLKYALDGLSYEIKDEKCKRLKVVKKAE